MRKTAQLGFTLISTLLASSLVVACGGEEKKPTGDGGAVAEGSGKAGGGGGGGGGKAGGGGGGKAGGGGGGGAKSVEGKPAGASAEAALKFTSWTPLHAFLGAPVTTGNIISATEAIVLTKDNHVGVTLDGGANWGFERVTTGTVRALAGAPGGPFAMVGNKGFLAISADGKSWTDLPRFTNDDLLAVAAGEGKVVAVGKSGWWVKVNSDGSDSVAGILPDKFKAGGVTISGGNIVLSSGKKLLTSTDARSWSPMEPPPVVAGSKDLMTSQGVCALGKVGKKKGVVCNLAGNAYGMGSDVLVVGKTWVAVSKDGGKAWALAASPIKGIKVVKGGGGSYHVGDGRGAVASSTDGKTWTQNLDATVLDGAPEFTAKLDPCDGAMPGDGEACALARVMTTPEGIPEVRGLRFVGDVGLAMGDSALVAMTADGGASWKVNSGFGLGGVQGFDLEKDTVIAVGKASAAVSTDAGKTFRVVPLPPKTPAIYATHIAADGSVYLAGRGGTILKAEPAVTEFMRLPTGDKNRTDYIYLHEVNGVFYGAGSRGELHRSADVGATWTPIATGITESIQRMAGDGDVVLAVSSPPRYGGNKLLRSNDKGEKFFVQRELSDQSGVYDFEFAGGTIRYENLQSTDFGATWTKHSEWYWPGSVDIMDGSGTRISNVSSYYGKDRFYVIGTEKDDYTVVDSFYNKGAWLRCAESSGCWMMAGGQVYRPR